MLEEDSHHWRRSTRPEVAALGGLGLSFRNSLVVTASLSFARCIVCARRVALHCESRTLAIRASGAAQTMINYSGVPGLRALGHAVLDTVWGGAMVVDCFGNEAGICARLVNGFWRDYFGGRIGYCAWI